jgi:pimeloyl-ACP methyl ester carboxylesterase
MNLDLPARFAAFQENHSLSACLVNGQSWRYISSGDGEAVLLLPGFFGTAGTDFLYILAFEKSCRVISVTYPEGIASIMGLVEGLGSFLDALGLQQVILLGGSYSGYIAQAFVRRHPKRVKKLILAQTAPPDRKHLPLALSLAGLFRWMPERLLRWTMRRTMRFFLPGGSPEQLFWRGYFFHLIDTFSRRAIYSRFLTVLDYHLRCRFTTADLAEWPGSILILESAQESLFGRGEAAGLRRLYPQARYELIPGDHIQSVDQPQDQIRAIGQFLF